MFNLQDVQLMGGMEKIQTALQHYYQFQVIIKPSPDEIKKVFLKSLSTIGINHKEHDIRFVEDDWESPTLRSRQDLVGKYGVMAWKLLNLPIFNK